MDSKELMAILDDWQSRKDDYMTTSLKLITIGCSPIEAMSLMKQYPQKSENEIANSTATA